MAGEKDDNKQQPQQPAPSADELKGVVKDLEIVPETMRHFYVKTDEGEYRLNAAGLVKKEKLDEFRENNIRLTRTNEELVTKYKDVDLDEYRAMKEAQQKQKDKKLIDEGKVDELVNE